MHPIGSIVWGVVAAYALIAGSSSMATRSQKVLEYLHKAHPAGWPSFGVGFDFTAAVSFSNDTTVTVAKISANDDYKEMLQRFSLESSRHPSPPYNNLGEAWDDIPRQWLRKARKAVSLAPSPDVARLAKMISDLRTQVEERTGTCVSSACVTTPHLIALYNEDLHDAFDYIGLTYLPYSAAVHLVLYETSAAYAGYGNGLCYHYKDHDVCKQEQHDMQMETVVAVLYTRNVLGLSLSRTQSAYYLFEPDYRADFTLGYDARESGGADEEEYWDAVESKLEEILLQNGYRRPDKVLLMGDRVEDGTFQRILEKTLRNHMAEMPEIYYENSEGVAANGAAEFAKRLPYTY